MRLVDREPPRPYFEILRAVILYTLYIIPGILYTRWYFKAKKEYKENHPIWENEMNTRGTQILNEAILLVR